MSFEWQTEDERSWDQPTGQGDETPRQRRRWPWLLLIIGVLASGAYFAWQQVQDRVEQGTEAVREEVRASYSLAERAASERDQELFVTLLSGRSATWTDAQRERLEAGLLFAGTGQLLAFRPLPTDGEGPQVELNPDLTEAVLTVAQPFAVDAGSALTETVTFTQTHIFRRGSQRWLLSPPDETYWGAWQTRDGRVLRLEYPFRDADLALRLHDDLERKLMEMCRTLVECPADFDMLLRLETDAQSILSVAGGGERLESELAVTLPTPTLVGLPVDEAAYAALFRGYASHVITAALINLSDYRCCQGAIFQEAVIDWQLSRLSLRSAPLSTEQYLYLVDVPLNAERLQQLWNQYEPLASHEEAPPEVHAFVDYLRERLAMRRDPLGDIQQRLSESRSFWGWVRALTGFESTDPATLQESWTDFVWQKVREAQALAQPLPDETLPAQDIVAMCGGQNLDLYRYSASTEQWTREVTVGVEFAVLAALPGGDGYIMTGQLPEQDFETGLVTYVKRGASEPFAIAREETDAGIIPWALKEPGTGRIVVWLVSSGSENGMTGTAMLDPASCTATGCQLQTIPGLPVWSPDGRLALAMDLNTGEIIYLPEGATRWQSMGQASGIWPFWLDERSFGYVETQTIGNENELLALDVQSGETTGLVTSTELAHSLGLGRRQRPVRMVFALRHPYRERQILIGATSPDSTMQSYLFSLALGDPQTTVADVTSRLTLLETFEGGLEGGWFGPNMLQNGRFLELQLYPQWGFTPAQLTLYDLREQRVVHSTVSVSGSGFLSGYGQWSADERWFLHALDGAIDLVAPMTSVDGHPARKVIFHDFERCESPSWVNPQ